jgi:methionine sulfoxide reductase heme-binding subunit
MRSTPVKSSSFSPLSALLWLAGASTLIAAVIVVAFLLQTPLGSSLAGFMSGLFSANTSAATWYMTRAAGLTAYILLWFSVAWGLAVPSKILDNLLHRSFTYDFHQFISLLALGFMLLHIGVLLLDTYLPFSVLQILVPFTSTYRPLWTGIGILGFYLALLVTVTYYIRGRIGMKAFRAIHTLSLLSYLGVTLHGLMSGTDSSLPSVIFLYAGTFLITVFLTAYWWFTKRQKDRQKRVVSPVGARVQSQ